MVQYRFAITAKRGSLARMLIQRFGTSSWIMVVFTNMRRTLCSRILPLPNTEQLLVAVIV